MIDYDYGLSPEKNARYLLYFEEVMREKWDYKNLSTKERKNIEKTLNIIFDMTNGGKWEKILEFLKTYGDGERDRIIMEIMRKVKEKERQIKITGLKVNNFVDNVLLFWEDQPFFYDRSGTFWIWKQDETRWDMIDEVDMMNAIDKNLNMFGQTVSSYLKSGYLESFKRVGRLKHPKEPKRKWTQFRNKVFDIETKETFRASPEYWFCNPIMWEIGDSSECPTMDKLFVEWCGEKNKETLYELIAYCCYTDYPIHLIFCLIGGGRNGKSSFLKLLSKFIGMDNSCSTELDLIIENRFESYKLYKKLIALMGETDFGKMSRTSLIKKLSGQDLIGYEAKNKTPFDGYNYAKIIIASNSLPTSEDSSDGFYRRWMIVDFPNKFKEGIDIIESIPDVEFNNLARKVLEILPQLLSKGFFSYQGTISERKKKYVMASNPLPYFIDYACDRDMSENVFIRYSELYAEYSRYLKKMGRRIVSKKEFSKILEEEGYEIRRTTKEINGKFQNDRWIENLRLKSNYNIEIMHKKAYDSCVPYDLGLSQRTSIGTQVGVPLQLVQTSQMSSKLDIKKSSDSYDTPFKYKLGFSNKKMLCHKGHNEYLIHHKCFNCGGTPCSDWYLGKPICADCLKGMEAQK